MNFSLGIEIVLTILLAATLFYCIALERRLAALRNGQDGLKKTLSALDGAVSAAGTSLKNLKSAAGEITQTLDERLGRARALADELGVLCTSGERIVRRFDSELDKRTTSAFSDLPSASVMSRLDAVRFADLGTVR